MDLFFVSRLSEPSFLNVFHELKRLQDSSFWDRLVKIDSFAVLFYDKRNHNHFEKINCKNILHLKWMQTLEVNMEASVEKKNAWIPGHGYGSPGSFWTQIELNLLHKSRLMKKGTSAQKYFSKIAQLYFWEVLNPKGILVTTNEMRARQDAQSCSRLSFSTVAETELKQHSQSWL